MQIDKSIKFRGGKSDLINIECTDQSVEIDDTLFVCRFISSSLEFAQEIRIGRCRRSRGLG